MKLIRQGRPLAVTVSGTEPSAAHRPKAAMVTLPMSWPDSPLPPLTVPVTFEDVQVPTAPVLVSVRVSVPAMALAVAAPPGETVQVAAVPASAATPPGLPAKTAAPATNPAIKRARMGSAPSRYELVPDQTHRTPPAVPALGTQYPRAGHPACPAYRSGTRGLPARLTTVGSGGRICRWLSISAPSSRWKGEPRIRGG